MNYVSSTDLSLKYQMFATSDRSDIGIRKFKFVAKTQFLKLVIYQSILYLRTPYFHLNYLHKKISDEKRCVSVKGKLFIVFNKFLNIIGGLVSFRSNFT